MLFCDAFELFFIDSGVKKFGLKSFPQFLAKVPEVLPALSRNLQFRTKSHS